jgi:serine/threonine protein kinase
METEIIDLTVNAGTQILPVGGATQLVNGTTTERGKNFTGGLLQVHEQIAGWEITAKLATVSGEADIYTAEKKGEKGIVKYYRSLTKPKTEILERLKNLDHPDIVNLYDFGMYNDRFYEIMEFAEGGALDTREEDGSYRYLPMSEEDVEGICSEVLNSYKICHEKGIIHRDIKPANIYFRNVAIEDVENDGEKKTVYKGNDIVIADFGISSVSDDVEQLHKTRTGSRTTGYAAPEVLSGIISYKMDYYALGITLWELLTGKDPFALDNGKRRNDAHLIRDTIEGRIADDMLSKEPRVSQKMERLIRGLLVIDPEYRWGFDEVTRHLAGENVDVYKKAKKTWTFSLGNSECTTLEDLGSTIMLHPEEAKKYIFRGLLSSFLEDDYPDEAKKISSIAEESSAANDEENGMIKIAYLLNPRLPLNICNGFQIENIEDAIFLLENAPESVVPMLRDTNSKLYTWLDIMGYADIAAEIKTMLAAATYFMCDTELAGKSEVLLRKKIIKPFKLVKYADFELSTMEQFRKVPKDMQARILYLVKEKSYEGLLLPWMNLLCPETNDYSYLLQTKYFGLPPVINNESENEKPFPVIDQFEIDVSHVKENIYLVSWDINQNGIDVTVFVDKDKVCDSISEKHNCEIELKPECFHEIEVMALSGGTWLPCKNKVCINTYSPCKIDVGASRITKDELNRSDNSTYNIDFSITMIDDIPNNVTAFYYDVTTQAPENKNDLIDNEKKIADARKITIDDYKKAGVISFKTTVKEENVFYFSIYTIYNINGKDVVSAPHKHCFARPLNANVFWKVTKPLIGNMKLSIEIKPSCQIMKHPKFVLCTSRQDTQLKSCDDKNSIVLMEIPETHFDTPKKIFNQEYVIKTEEKVSKNQRVFLFDIASNPNEEYSIRWAEDFKGKI